eukprot:14812861-Alexandrium_andersonii.AAC.1
MPITKADTTKIVATASLGEALQMVKLPNFVGKKKGQKDKADNILREFHAGGKVYITNHSTEPLDIQPGMMLAGVGKGRFKARTAKETKPQLGQCAPPPLWPQTCLQACLPTCADHA